MYTELSWGIVTPYGVMNLVNNGPINGLYSDATIKMLSGPIGNIEQC